MSYVYKLISFIHAYIYYMTYHSYYPINHLHTCISSYITYHLLSTIFSSMLFNIMSNSLNSGQVSPYIITAILSNSTTKYNLESNSLSYNLPLLSNIPEIIVSEKLIAHINKHNNSTVSKLFS